MLREASARARCAQQPHQNHRPRHHVRPAGSGRRAAHEAAYAGEETAEEQRTGGGPAPHQRLAPHRCMARRVAARPCRQAAAWRVRAHGACCDGAGRVRASAQCGRAVERGVWHHRQATGSGGAAGAVLAAAHEAEPTLAHAVSVLSWCLVPCRAMPAGAVSGAAGGLRARRGNRGLRETRSGDVRARPRTREGHTGPRPPRGACARPSLMMCRYLSSTFCGGLSCERARLALSTHYPASAGHTRHRRM